MVVYSILKPSAAEADKPYTWGIILWGGKFTHLIDQEIVPLLSEGQLVFDLVDLGSHPLPNQSEGRTVLGRGLEEEKLYYSPITKHAKSQP